MAGWYIVMAGEKHGPLTSDQLKQLARTGTLKPADIIWREGLPKGVPASRAKGLFPEETGREESFQPNASVETKTDAQIAPGVLQADRTQASTKQCPFCAEQIATAAVKCKHCGEFLDAGKATPGGPHPPTATPTGDGVIVFSGDYSVAYQAMRETLSLLGGTIKVDEQANGKLEAAWRYGLNAFGLRVAVFFRSRDDQSIEITCRGRFKDALDTFGGARKKRDSVIQDFVRRFSDNTRSAGAALPNTQKLPEPPSQQGASPPPVTTGSVPHRGKTKVLAGLLGLLLGGLGIHKFYLGCWGWGIIYIMFVWTWIPAIVGSIEGIVFLVMAEDNFDQKYNYRTVGPFTW